MASSQEEQEVQLQEESYGFCGCFRLFSFRRMQTSNDGSYTQLMQGETSRNINRKPWLVEKLKKAKEVSELVAGPRWKTFLRKIGANFSSNKRENDIGYDSYDYALNFDEGTDDDGDEGEHRYNIGFSARFAAPVPNTHKSSQT